MNPDLQKILDLVKEFAPTTELSAESDLYILLQDWFEDFLKIYSTRFDVNMIGYRKYFHTTDCEKYSLLTSLRTYKRMIVTPRLLLKFAEAGKWDVTYPPQLMRAL